MRRHVQTTWPRKVQGGTLIEALVAILIFSFGIIGLVGLQATSIRTVADAKYRSDAAFFANQIIGRMWAGAPGNLPNFAHRQTGGACAPTGTDSTHADVTAWLSAVNSGLPGAAASKQQILVDTATNLVTVTVCWQSPQDASSHNFVTVAQIRG